MSVHYEIIFKDQNVHYTVFSRQHDREG